MHEPYHSVDYNLLLRKVFTKDLACHLKLNAWLAQHQYGSCNGCTAYNTALNLVMAHEHLLFTCTNALEFNNDDSTCYDRIVPNMANLVIQWAGLDPKIASIYGQVLKSAACHLCTNCGTLLLLHQCSHFWHRPRCYALPNYVGNNLHSPLLDLLHTFH